MTPQDPRSPMRNQRWVECQGSDLSFGDCVLITDSTRAETGAFSDGIRTIFQVATPNEDSQPNTIIIGHMEGSQGYCTNDFPTYAKCDQNVSVGDEVGPVAGSRTLSPAATGYLVMGDIQNGMARVRRLDKQVTAATIVFTMTSDRTREQIGAGDIGFANAIINDKVGSAGDAIGSTVRIVFADKRWLESVTGCQGIADYVYDPAKAAELQQEDPFFWIVKECQGLVQGFYFRTLEDRTSGAPDQDVMVSPIKNIGHANDDFPIEYRFPPQNSQVDCGSIELQWNVSEGRWVITDYSNFNPCCTFGGVLPAPPADPSQPQSYTWTGPFHQNIGCTDDKSNFTGLKVRYLAETFPRMLTGALGYAQLDNDITNTSDNTTMRYYVTQSDQRALSVTGFLTVKMCGDTANVRDVYANTFWPFSQLPEAGINYFLNTKSHGGMETDEVTAEWDDTLEDYNVNDVTRHLKQLSTNLGVSEEDGCYSISHTPVGAYIEMCEEGESVGLLSYRTQEVTDVTNLRVDKDQGEGTSCNEPKLIIDVTRYQGLVMCALPVPDVVEMALTPKTVTTDVADDGDCVYQTRQQIITLGDCGDSFEVDIFCTTDEQCDEGSGSGQ